VTRHFAVVLLLALLLAIGFYLIAQKLTIKSDRIVKRRGWKIEAIELADLAEIKFHYHAVVGFTCVWEFVSRSGVSLQHESAHISETLLAELERFVPGFTRSDFHRKFEEGDVEDSLEIWRADLGARPSSPKLS